MAPKAKKFKSALKSAARLRVPKPGAGSGRAGFAPIPGENPIVILRLQVLGCKELLAKDKNGFSDPFVAVSVLNTRHQTPVIKRSLDPVYQPKDATFDFPLFLSLAGRYGAAEVVVWDKDMLKKDYLGEVALPLEDWFPDGRPFGFDDPSNNPISVPLESTRTNTAATGSVQIKLGFITPPTTHEVPDYKDIFEEFIKRSRPSVVSAPPTEGVGTVRSNRPGHFGELEDDGGISSDSEDESSDEEDGADDSTTSVPATPKPEGAATPLAPEISTAVPKVNFTPASPEAAPKKAPMKATSSSSFLPRMKFTRKSSSSSTNQGTDPSSTSDVSSSPTSQGTGPSASEKKTFRKSWGTRSASRPTSSSGGYNLGSGNDIVGIVMLEVQSADDLPRLANMTRTGWDMDPFVVISFGKKVFRTRVIRHSRSPVWDEKLLFHVRRYETAFKVQFAILDWDKLSSNDHIGDAELDIKELVDNSPQPDPNTGIFQDNNDEHSMKEYKLPLRTAKEMPWEAKHNPTLTFKAKYQPYSALRQQFWRQYLKQYDTDDTLSLSHLEITSMLDSLGSTLTRHTVTSFFTRCGQDPHTGELTFDQVIQCLETELNRPDSEKRKLDPENDDDTSVSATPILSVRDGSGQELKLENLDFSGPAHSRNGGAVEKPMANAPHETEPSQQPLLDAAAGDESLTSSDIDDLDTSPANEKKSKKSKFRRNGKKGKKEGSSSSSSSPNAADLSVERVINVKNCPLCHRPRLNDKAEVDIITHLAVCASQDWNRMDKIVVGNFVTASQAQRKWYTRIVSKISSGDYRLGANSANIIVQNRMTGQLEEEKMQVYVRLGIRLLYKGAKGRMEGGRARSLLKSLSIKQGVKYDDPQSAADIPSFIAFHNLKVGEILDPLNSFKNFNEFFYRKLQPSARPLEEPDNPYRLVSAADCRLMTFQTVDDATRLWIKGREFSVERLLGDTYKADAHKYIGGALAIFRLAPQDYHRFHSPVEGKIGKMTYISGEYYTVNPQAIRTSLDVYGENARKIVPIDSPHFGRVYAACIGAMMVGTIKTTVEEGEYVQRGQEFGYFAFGGSTIVILFERGAVEWDEDLVNNGRASLETLVRVGMGLGRGKPSS